MPRRNKPSRNGVPPQQVRIIGGRWRGRKLVVETAAELRPTPDRVRETLFNWLMPYLEGAHCLDLFAGSGALGFEALSRGADSVVMVESNPDLAERLRQQAAQFGVERLAQVVEAEALSWLKGGCEPFDVIFLDPPYSGDLLERASRLLIESGRLADGALIYVESSVDTLMGEEPQLEKIKQGRAGQVQYRLLKFQQLASNDENSHLSGNV